GLARADGQGSVRVFSVREGRLSGSENFDLVGLGKHQSDADILNAFVSQYYANATHIPKEVFVPEALPDRELIEQWLSERRGSMWFCGAGRLKPAHDRHFRIKTVQGANDFAMLQEVLRRRFSRHAQSEEGIPEEPSFSRLPDLVLIDGGKGQLSAAREVMESMGLGSVSTFGLAKEHEELVGPG